MGNFLSTAQVCDALHDITEIENILKGRLISKITTNEISISFNEKAISHYMIILHIAEKTTNKQYKIGLMPDYITPLKLLKNETKPIHFKTPISIKYIKEYNQIKYDSHGIEGIEHNLKFNQLIAYRAGNPLQRCDETLYYNINLSPFIGNDEMKELIIESKSFPDSVNNIIYEYSMDIRDNTILHCPYFEWYFRAVCTRKKTTSLLNMKFIDFREIKSSETSEKVGKMKIELLKTNGLSITMAMETERGHEMGYKYESIVPSKVSSINTDYDRDIYFIQTPQRIMHSSPKRSMDVPFRMHNFHFPTLFVSVGEMLKRGNIANVYKIVEIYPGDKDLLIDNGMATVDANHTLHPNLSEMNDKKIGGLVVYRWDKDAQKDSSRFGIYAVHSIWFDSLYLWDKDLISNHCDYTLFTSFEYYSA